MNRIRVIFALSVFCVTPAVFADFKGRLPATPGGTDYQAYYDDQLDITWLADWNVNGNVTWNEATEWAAGLDVNGVSGWRLPSALRFDGSDVCDGGDCLDTELGALYLSPQPDGLGNLAFFAGCTLGLDCGLVNTSPFQNIQALGYWTSTEVGPSSPTASWGFGVGNGITFFAAQGNGASAVAVHDGDVSAAPSVLSLNFTRIADLSTSIPGGTGTFTSVFGPSLEGDTVAFLGNGDSGQNGIYVSNGGPPLLVADRNTAVPDDVGTFFELSRPSQSGGNVIFANRGQTNVAGGLYQFDGVELTTIFDKNTPIPGIGLIREYRHPATDETGSIAFASGFPTGTFALQNGSVSQIVNSGTVIPGTTDTFSSAINNPAIDEETVAFLHIDTNIGIFGLVDGNLIAVADQSTQVPGRSNNFTNFGAPDVEGNSVALTGVGDGTSGVYLFTDGMLQIVVNESTLAPDGTAFTSAGLCEIDNGRIFFNGRSSGNQTGVFMWSDGSITPLLLIGDEIDDKIFTGGGCSAKSVDGNSFAVTATFEDGSRGIYRADFEFVPATLPESLSAELLIHLSAGEGIVESFGTVSEWRDGSGNGFVFDVGRPGAGDGPAFVADLGNGQPGVFFDGSDVLTSTEDLQLFKTSSDGLTTFTVFRTGNNDQQSFIATQNLDTSQGFVNFELGYDTGSQTGQGNFGLHRGNFDATIAQDGAVQNGELALFSTTVLPIESSPNNVIVHKNGGQRFVVTDNGGWLNAGDYRTDQAPLDIGGRFEVDDGSLGALHTGDIAEVVIYQGNLTDAERVLVEDALLTKYGIPREPSDRDGDTILDDQEGAGDFDEDGVANLLDTDSDDDGISDFAETPFKTGRATGPIVFSSIPELPVGNTVTAFLSFDASQVPEIGSATLSVVDQLNGTLRLNIGGLDFDQSGDPGAPGFPVVEFIDGQPVGLDFGSGSIEAFGLTLNLATTPLAGGVTTNQVFLRQGSDTLFEAVLDFARPTAFPNDSDGDGDPDYLDVEVVDSDNDGLSDADEASLGTDPNTADTDADGLTDGQEVIDFGTDPLDADTDDDSLLDGNEINFGANPFSADTDQDGIDDGTEVAQGSDPTSGDSDGDGVGDPIDNCVSVPNANQANADGNAFGDVCDTDFIGPATVIFEDTFQPVESPLWKPFSGDWVAGGGVYGTTSGFGGYSYLPLSLTDFAVDIDIKSLQDGGIWLRSTPNNQGALGAFGVVLITGGLGGGGNGLYWHVDDGVGLDPVLNLNEPLGLNGTDAHIRVEVRGDTFSAFVNGGKTPATVLTLDPAQAARFSSGFVGLYDASPTQSIDNFRIESLPPEPFDLGSVYFDDFDGGLTVLPGVTNVLSGVATTESVRGYAGLGNAGNTFGGLFLRNSTGGDFGGGAIGDPGNPSVLTLTGLPPHTGIDIDFLLGKVSTWDGSDPDNFGPDVFEIRVDGITVFSESFGFIDPSFVPAPGSITLADSVDLGFSRFDSAYDMEGVGQLSDIPHTSNSLTIEWLGAGAGWQGGDDESWAIDNIDIGLTDRDTDFDGVTDTLDNCATIPNSDQADSNSDGFGDECVSPDVTIPPGANIGSGVTIGSGTTIRPGVTIGDNTTIGDNVTVRRDASIGSDSIIGEGSTIRRNANVGNGVDLGENVVIGNGASVADGATLENGVRVGRGAFLGEGSTLGEDSRVGANVFVGVGSLIGSDSTVNNGVSLGDFARLGSGVAIARDVVAGAALLVGKNSRIGQQSQLGDQVAISSEVNIAQLVVIDDLVYVGRGSSIARNVEIGAESRIGTGVRIRRDAMIGARAWIGSTATIRRNVVLPDGTLVPDNLVIPANTVVSSADTDADGFFDDIEILAGTDPTDNQSRPAFPRVDDLDFFIFNTMIENTTQSDITISWRTSSQADAELSTVNRSTGELHVIRVLDVLNDVHSTLIDSLDSNTLYDLRPASVSDDGVVAVGTVVSVRTRR